MDHAALTHKLNSLKEEHRTLDEQITQLLGQPLHDQLAAQRMKKRKLQLKDEIIRTEAQLFPDILA